MEASEADDIFVETKFEAQVKVELEAENSVPQLIVQCNHLKQEELDIKCEMPGLIAIEPEVDDIFVETMFETKVKMELEEEKSISQLIVHCHQLKQEELDIKHEMPSLISVEPEVDDIFVETKFERQVKMELEEENSVPELIAQCNQLKHEEIDIKPETSTEDLEGVAAEKMADKNLHQDSATIKYECTNQSMKTHKCEKCSFETRKLTDFEFHVFLKHRGNSVNNFECSFCDYKTINEFNLKKHQLTHDNESEDKIYKCPNCAFSTKFYKNLKLHALIHQVSSDMKIFRCKSCLYKTKFSDKLQRHISLEHEDTDTGAMKCKFCEYRTLSKGGFNRHMVKHRKKSEVPIFKCKYENCSFQTKYKQSLQGHSLLHKDKSEIKFHKCKVCDYESKYAFNLRKHEISKHKSGKSKS